MIPASMFEASTDKRALIKECRKACRETGYMFLRSIAESMTIWELRQSILYVLANPKA